MNSERIREFSLSVIENIQEHITKPIKEKTQGFRNTIEEMLSSLKSAPTVTISRNSIPPASKEASFTAPSTWLGFIRSKISFKTTPKQSDNSFSSLTVDSKPVESKEKTTKAYVEKQATSEAQKERAAQQIIEALTRVKINLKSLTVDQIETHKIEKVDNRPIELNLFGSQAYNGPGHKDFTDRQTLLYEAAKQYISNNKDISSEKKEQLEQALTYLSEHYERKIQADCKVDSAIMNNPEKLAEAQAHYAKQHKQALDYQAQFAKDIVYVINIMVPKTPQQKAFSLNQLQQLEKECVIKRGRPTILNVYQVGGKTFISMQEPAVRKGETVLPSSVRDRKGLANYVTTTFAILKDDGNPEILFQATRHSSYPPIAINDHHERAAIAYENCKQGILDQAQRRYGYDHVPLEEGQIVVVPLRTMMLLTAKQGDFIKNRQQFVIGEWKGESETLQLEESVAALSRCRDRTFETEIKGVRVLVKADISCMNLGANVEASRLGLGKLPNASLQRLVNARGFEEFQTECVDHLDYILKGENSLKDLHQAYQNIWELHPKVQTARSNLEKVKRLHTQTLIQHYDSLDTLKPDDNKKRAEIKAHIKELEQEVYQAYYALNVARKQVYQEKKTKIEDLEYQIKDAYGNISPEKKKIRDFHLNLFQAQKIFFNKEYENPLTITEFQVLYIEQQNFMDNSVEFFCKSAEDRTGRVNNIIEEREIYRSLNEKYPLSVEERTGIETDIAPKVSQYSASLNNTRENSNARGLQIGDKVNPATILPKSNKLSATMSKKVFNKAKKKSISQEARDVIKAKPEIQREPIVPLT